ncbi:MAG: sigma-54-dependent transcriptional regulator [Planctomycetota bacterium]|jgi:psp operon transcriptional activator PspF
MFLLVDDQPEVAEHVARILRKQGHKSECVTTAHEAIERLEANPRRYTLAILDLDLGGGGGADEGLGLLERVQTISPDLPVLILTGKGSIELAVRAVKLGAQDFLEKDMYIEESLGASLVRVNRFIDIVERTHRLEEENQGLRRTAAFVKEMQTLKYQPVGDSEPFLEVLERARRLASIPRPVLIRGERGSGKELIAATIHHAGERHSKPFIKVNCAAFAGQLLESEMFGHEKGAFTGADSRRIGRFELADKGTLLLDEIGNMSPEFQEKVLRVIEYQEFERVGGTRPIKVDVRVIAATNADLEERIAEGSFRADLYDRLSFEVLRVPPLRERTGDIAKLVDHFATRFAQEVKLPPRSFSKKALAVLDGYAWPGNVRELKNIVERVVFSARGDVADVADLPREVREGKQSVGQSFTDRILALERELLEEALEGTHWNQKKAAERLELTYDQLRHYYKKHDLKKPG